MKSSRVFVLMVFFLGFFFITQSLFVVMQNQAALVTHLGDLKVDSNGNALVFNPGLHYKIPVVDRLVRLDKRLQSFDVPSTRVLTQDQKSVFVDYYAKWRIKNYAKFFRSTSANYYNAQELLKRKISDALRAEFGTRNLSEIISGEQRIEIMEKMSKIASESAANIGVEVQDVRMKRIDYPQEVTLSVYERMRSSRNRDAKRYRATGAAKAEDIRSQADRDAGIILYTAKKNAAKEVAIARKKASSIYREAYEQAPDLYKLYLGMEGYKQSINDDDVLVVHPNDDRFYSFMMTGGN